MNNAEQSDLPVTISVTGSHEIEEFLLDAQPRLMRAFLGSLGPSRADDALSAAFEWAFGNWERLSTMSNPVGYLYRVGASRSMPPKAPVTLPEAEKVGLPDFEPRLVPALMRLPHTQRTAVWLIHACGWNYADAADAMDVGESTVGTHVSRGLAALRREMVATGNEGIA